MDEEEAQQHPRYEVHEGIIFVIELTKTIFLPNSTNGKSNLQEILEILNESMAHSIITLPNTGYGCYFFHSGNDQTSQGLKPGLEKLFSLTDLNYSNMKIVQDILEENVKTDDDSRVYRSLEDRFPVLETDDQELKENQLYEILVTLQDEFLIKKDFQKQYNNNKIFLFTDNDTPINPENVSQKNILRRLYNDLDDAHINISPFLINSSYKQFDPKIYSELFSITHDNPNDELEAGESSMFDGPSTKPIDVSIIKQRVLRRKEIRRIQFQCPLIFNDNLIVGVKGYSIYTHEKSQRNKYVYETENFRKNVYSKRRFFNEKTGAEFDKTVKIYKFGSGEDDAIKLTNDQIFQLQTYDENYDCFLKLLGFKNEKFGNKFHYNTSKIPFVIPDEDKYDGSRRTLSALYQSLQKLEKIAILFGKLRKSGQPSLYALQITKTPFPEGFMLIRLPFLDDIRKIPEGYEYYNEPSNDLKLVTKSILKNLILKGYQPKDYKNPSLQLHFKILHDYLLQVEVEDESQIDGNEDNEENKLLQDDTLNKIHQVRKRVEASQLEGKMKIFENIRRWNSIYNRK
ncbi:hypothetical protein BN7_5924 [Wickerhamomyces ciferrii]|uniref:ATP-dependent DNA helicase II subunit 1 n=1 Tax=Wickerhamomyces ciferrii (strain ATCC 14091 / BCRC 22168 / CBS 111 / JCM 3599 / NBRC 0793 / NRRL Y-1031 F-60-10) TaxID=1206466 RepID=K0KT55_WICCF|nr:uncharacterized protein BN7_5924 [Wickerhamomyces ciferrii]CCH46331.1 hypothetical protein BN7_5924 [Wickerhamomyces ciferrii]